MGGLETVGFASKRSYSYRQSTAEGHELFVIEDELHAEPVGEFDGRADAIAELQRLAGTPWNVAPNVCPCRRRQTCARRYHLIEYDTAQTPWRQLSNVPALEVSAAGTSWLTTIGG